MIGLYVTVPIACFRKGHAREYLETEVLPPPSTCYGFLLSLVGETDRRRHLGCRVTAGKFGGTAPSVVLRKVWRVKTANGWKSPRGDWVILSDSEKRAFSRWATNALCEFGAECTQSWSDLFMQWNTSGRPDIGKKFVDQELKGVGEDEAKAIKSRLSRESELVPVSGTGENTRPDYQQLLTDVTLLIWLDSSEENAEIGLENRVQRALSSPGEVSRFGGLSLGESTHMVNDVSVFDPDRHYVDAREFLLFTESERGRLTLPVWVDHVGSAGTVYVTGNLEESGVEPPDVSRMPRIVDSAQAVPS